MPTQTYFRAPMQSSRQPQSTAYPAFLKAHHPSKTASPSFPKSKPPRKFITPGRAAHREISITPRNPASSRGESSCNSSRAPQESRENQPPRPSVGGATRRATASGAGGGGSCTIPPTLTLPRPSLQLAAMIHSLAITLPPPGRAAGTFPPRSGAPLLTRPGRLRLALLPSLAPSLRLASPRAAPT